MKKILKEELVDLNRSKKFLSGKVDERLDIIRLLQTKMKLFETKNMDTVNENKNLENRVTALERRLNKQKQQYINTPLVIVRVSQEDNTITSYCRACYRLPLKVLV